MRTSVTDRNNSVQLLGDRVNSGFVRFYTGLRPASPDDALGANTLVVQVTLGSPAFGTPSGGSRTGTTSPGVIASTGTPTFARFYRADGVTAVVDMSVPDELTLSKNDWTAGEPFGAVTVTWSQPVGE